MVRWCWVNFQGGRVEEPLISIIVGQGHIGLQQVRVCGGCLDIFLRLSFSLLSPSFWVTARYRLKYCLKEPLQAKQPTNQNVVGNVLLENKAYPVQIALLTHYILVVSSTIIYWTSPLVIFGVSDILSLLFCF